MSTPLRFQVNKRVEMALKKRHPWIYRGQCSSALDALPVGSFLRIVGTQNNFLAIAIYEPLSAIAIRVISFQDITPDTEFFMTLLIKAWDKRQKQLPRFGATGFRWVHGEADNLPGVAIDVYGDTAIGVFYLPSLIFPLKEALIRAAENTGIKNIWLKKPHQQPDEENPLLQIYGKDALEEPLFFQESGRTLMAFPSSGLKTGFFLDLRQARFAMPRLVFPGAHVLNLFANDGVLSAIASESGAAKVISVDRNPNGRTHSRHLYKKWQLRFSPEDYIEADVWEWLEGAAKTHAGFFDLVIIDPPALAKSQNQLPAAKKAWIKLHALTLPLMKNTARWLSISCSERITGGMQKEWTRAAISGTPTRIEEDEVLPANFDHPVLKELPERDYFRAIVWQVRKSGA